MGWNFFWACFGCIVGWFGCVWATHRKMEDMIADCEAWVAKVEDEKQAVEEELEITKDGLHALQSDLSKPE